MYIPGLKIAGEPWNEEQSLLSGLCLHIKAEKAVKMRPIVVRCAPVEQDCFHPIHDLFGCFEIELMLVMGELHQIAREQVLQKRCSWALDYHI